MDRIVLHIDVNSAFLSWSAIKLLKEGYKKDIRNEVSVIAGDPSKRHGVIVAASIPAKKVGIKPPTNLSDARKIYKDLIVVKPDMNFYKYASNKLMTFLKKIFPIVEQYSIDECFIDYTSVKKLYGDEVEFAYKLKNEILRRFKFTVNIGIGNSKLSAKMASDFEKPNKVHTLYDYEFKEKVHNKDISELFMAGKASCNKLRSLGINTIGELANYDELTLVKHLKKQGKLLYEYANGIDNSDFNIESYDERKSIGFSKTLASDTENKATIYNTLKQFSEDISKKLKEKNIYANTITVTIRNNDFKTVNHQEKTENSVNSLEDIYEYSKKLFNKLWDNEPIRLIGLSVSNFTEYNNYQLSIFDKRIEEKKEIDEIIDRINKELGNNTIFKGTNLK